jgi:hypothetical protein
MQLSYSKDNGYVLANLATKTLLNQLTYKDASDLISDSGRMTYDRRLSFTKISNRLWADGVQW